MRSANEIFAECIFYHELSVIYIMCKYNVQKPGVDKGNYLPGSEYRKVKSGYSWNEIVLKQKNVLQTRYSAKQASDIFC